MKNPFRYLWEWFAYIQAFLDDTILYSIKKLQAQADKETDPEKIKQIHKKIWYYIWKWLSGSLWEWFGWFYEKYADLKKWNNMAQTAIEEDIPRMRIKAKMLKVKMEIMWIKKWDIKSLVKLKDKTSIKNKIRIKAKMLKVKNELRNFETIWNLEDIKNLKYYEWWYKKNKN